MKQFNYICEFNLDIPHFFDNPATGVLINNGGAINPMVSIDRNIEKTMEIGDTPISTYHDMVAEHQHNKNHKNINNNLSSKQIKNKALKRLGKLSLLAGVGYLGYKSYKKYKKRKRRLF